MAETLDFEELVARFYQPLYQFAFSLTRSEADACDLTQQTFLVWGTKGHQLRDKTKLKTWLFTTLHREFLQSRRRRTRFPHLDIDSALHELPSEPAAEITASDAAQAVAALSRVDEPYQAPVALFYLQDCSYLEIADILGVPLGTVKSRLSRGISQLQQILSRDLNAGRQPDSHSS